MINLNNELISSLNDFRPKFDSEGKAANIYQLYKNIHIINPDLPELKFNLTTKGNKSAKNRIIAMRGYQGCEICGSKDYTTLHIHHILPRSKGGTNDDSNLMILCPHCHSDVHRHRYDKNF